MKILKLFFCLLVLQSCHKKKLTEVVEVPLPTAQETTKIGNPNDVNAVEGTFKLLKLSYNYDAFEPSIDARTMEIHYSKHYVNYLNNLNKAIANTENQTKSLEELLINLDVKNEDLKNNLGGVYNHNLYFESIGGKKNQIPKDTLSGAINKSFGSFENFTSVFKSTASKQFGSGWTFLIITKKGMLEVVNSQNQDNPLMPNAIVKGKPILAIDLWEHAYYLNYQNKRNQYIDAFFNIINWENIARNYEESLK